MSFTQALSGLFAASENINATGNNIANAETVGFKSSKVQFVDMYAGQQISSRNQIGRGVMVAGVLQDFNNGTLENTNRSLDLGINGRGLLRFNQGGQVVYSRNGQLTMTKEGFLENVTGAKLTGYPAGVTGGQPDIIRVPPEGLEAKATEGVQTTINLDARVSPPTGGTFDPDDPSTYSYTNSGTVFDSLGVRHIMATYFVKTTTPNEWEVHVRLDNAAADNNPPSTLTFDANGNMTGGSPVTYTFDPNVPNPASGAAVLSNIPINFNGTTQFGNDFSISSLVQDGYTSGELVGIRFDEDGQIIGTYANEQTRPLGTIVMADFRNQEGLQRVGNNEWVETGASGQALLGKAGQGQFGTLIGGSVEASNVDLSKELVNLIIAQRDYQANAETIRTQDTILQTAVNLKN